MKKRLFLGFGLAIILLFLVTRLFQITKNPSSLYWDEASLLYNGYSIGIDGKDEWGEFLPIHFRAFGEFKLPVYIYTTAVFTKLFGLSELSVRLPAVLFSLGVILVLFFITFQLTKSKLTGLIGAFLLVVMPWFFIFSRTGFEVTSGMFFYNLGILLLLLQKRRRLMIMLAAVAFCLSMYSYNAFRLTAIPTFLLVMLVVYSNQQKKWRGNLLKSVKRHWLTLLLSTVFFGVALVPIVRLFLFDSGFNRILGLSLFPIVRVVTWQDQHFLRVIPPTGGWEALGGNYLTILKNILSYLLPDFLFVNGDANPRHQLAG
ncbi:MAG: hypothetical protein ACD_58C00313G0001, partial [uncultured bacterium]